MDTIKLCKKVVSILANAGTKAKYIIGEACETFESKGIHIAQPNWETWRGGNFYTQIAEDNGWLIQRNKAFKQYRIVGPDNMSYVSILWQDKFESFLDKIIEIGNVQGISKYQQTMSIYQIVVDDCAPIKESCKNISFDEAENKFPNTKNISAGFFTVHPCDPRALTPVENYFMNLNLNKEDEFIVLLGKMGARSIHRTLFDGNAKAFGLDAGGEIKRITITAGSTLGKEVQSFTGPVRFFV
jgi:hypothetical protein